MLRKCSFIVTGLIGLFLLTACDHKLAETTTAQEQAQVISHIASPTPVATKAKAATPVKAKVSSVPAAKKAAVTDMTEGDLMGVISEDLTKEFYYEKLPDIVIDRIQGKSYKKDCTVPYSELRYVRVLYRGFDGEDHRGELIVNKAIAKDTVEIFRELYDKNYPIERMVLVDDYDADDNASMAADNTSSFNYRKVDGKDKLSLHSYGLAIDVNPLYNPYVHTLGGKEVITPKEGEKYADRSLSCSYFIDKKDVCYKIFTKHGFTWGGDWVHSKDYQHFQKTLD